MINLLLVDAIEKNFSHTIIKKIAEDVRPDNLFIIVCEKNEVSLFRDLGTCYVREDIIRGKYSDEQWKMKQYIPPEDEIYEYMNPYLLEILQQQKRFEQRYDYHIDSSWNTHYEIYMHNLEFWYNMLINNKITHVFMTLIPHEGYESIIYHLCKFIKIPVIMTFESLIPTRNYVLRDYTTAHLEIGKKYEELLEYYKNTPIEKIELYGMSKHVYEQWSSLDPQKMLPIYMKGNRMKKTFHMRYGQTNIFKVWLDIVGANCVKYGKGIPFLKTTLLQIPYMLRQIPITFRRWKYARPYWKKTVTMRNYYNSMAQDPVSGERYVYFALHYQPEATSNPIGGGAYVDQRVPLRILSSSIPEDMKIYVKIHPDQLAFFGEINYFKDMSRLPNVKLMKESCSSFELMKNSVAVASIAGTACWECQFWGKPAILFGYSYKNVTPLAFPVRTKKECEDAIQKILFDCPKTDLKSLKIFVKLMQDISFNLSDVDEEYPEIVKELVREG